MEKIRKGCCFSVRNQVFLQLSKRERLTGKAQPDLFDTATVLLEDGRKDKAFLKKLRHKSQARENLRYKRFEIACRLARLIIKNGAYGGRAPDF